MAEARRLRLYSIPPHRAFADALVAGLLRRFGGDATDLARGIVIVPTNRARRAIVDAFVRASGGALLLPRIVAVGDAELDESVGALFDSADDTAPIPPAIEPMERRMLLARLVQEADPALDAAEAVRLAGDLARTLDQLLVEEIAPERLRDVTLAEGLSAHWERALSSFALVLDRWPQVLGERGRIALAERRSRLLDRVGAAWRDVPPAGFVCTAGVTSAAPAVARLLRVVAGLDKGMVVLPGLGLAMGDAEWEALGPHAPDPVTGRRARAETTHPQFHLKLLLDRMQVARGEFRTWRAASEVDAPPARSRAIATALAPADFTHGWSALARGDRNLGGVAAIEVATPAEEAQAIALALREVLETPGRTGALITPDRALARRVGALCARWGIAIDDSAGQPLSQMPPGTLLLALAEAATGDFAPLPLLALLKHPLVAAGADRGAWLAGVRALDLALRGPRPPIGLAGLAEHFAAHGGAAAEAWPGVQALLEPLAAGFTDGKGSLAAMLACLRDAAGTLCGDGVWARAEGRAAAELIADLEHRAELGPPVVASASLPALLRTLMDETAVRPQQGGHPRLAIYGLLEARLQTADLMVLGGLNEGVWPGIPSPDPWLAPRIRAELGLPGLEFRIGLAAHDLASGLGAPQVLLTRARRDARSPTIASRFWLRLQALAGEAWARDDRLAAWARAIDHGGVPTPVDRPEPVPAAALRPRTIAVTDVDRLKADPYAFYAQKMLRLRALDAVDADPTAAWRGTAVHAILKAAWEADGLAPDTLRRRTIAWLADAHPMMRALWQPRLLEAIDWIASEITAIRAEGREVEAVERRGEIAIAGVTLNGTFDRLDRLADGSIAIVDYKTGKPPTAAAVRAGFSLQLGLLGLIAERGGFDGVRGTAGAFEYWSLGKGRDGFGYVATPVDPAGKRDRIVTADFTGIAAAAFGEAAAHWLTGNAPFTAKLVPEYAPYSEYDQLMRRDEWYGRE
ncbi:double-strand break repair protein AddB [Sphingomonas donggukensis]|uniref:Double-strand break repair protein AddB n=1 Tax=Sphingomonas donggukensis TaxID=2949093 RepID=A0ABY4TVB0_9SPHN|nr:double-strand break repair protein AddB [Sphingomonas donggukensis]URW76307.1 double-strand break repair protein AddB [Sphingomonas donggukensis]